MVEARDIRSSWDLRVKFDVVYNESKPFRDLPYDPGWWTNHPMLNVFVARIAGLGGVVVY